MKVRQHGSTFSAVLEDGTAVTWSHDGAQPVPVVMDNGTVLFMHYIRAGESIEGRASERVRAEAAEREGKPQ